MRSKPDCLYCCIKQALSAARAAGVDEARQMAAMAAVMEAMSSIDLSATPAYNSTLALWAAHRSLENGDPFAAQKRRYNALALQLYPRLKALVDAADCRLEAAVKLAIAGNVIDLGILERQSDHEVDIEGSIHAVFAQGLARDDQPALEEALGQARHVLYLADNAGEIVFDRLLVEELTRLGRDVTVAVKERPILNYVMEEDAREAGIDHCARVISTGSGEIGVPLARCSDAFRRAFASSDLILSKGQGNLETLDDTPAPVFFLLKAKCEVTAAALGVRLGEMVLMRSQAWQARR